MTPIAPLITAFLREHMPIERGYSPNTCETYAHAFRLLFEFASNRLGRRPSQLCIEHMTAALVLDFLKHIETARSNTSVTRNSRLAAVKAFMRYVELRVPSSLEQAHQIRAIPTKRHDQALVQHLTMNQMRAILETPNLATRLGSETERCCIFASLAAFECLSWWSYLSMGFPYGILRASVCAEKAGESDASRYGRKLPRICERGWLFAVLSALRSYS